MFKAVDEKGFFLSFLQEKCEIQPDKASNKMINFEINKLENHIDSKFGSSLMADSLLW